MRVLAEVAASRRPAALAALLVAVRLAVPPAGAPAAAAGFDAERWHRIDGERYVLLGDVPLPTLRELAADLEALDALLAGLNPAESPPALPADVFVLASREAFAELAPRAADGRPLGPPPDDPDGRSGPGSASGGSAAVAGFFLTHPHGDFIAVDASAGRDLRRVLYHEVLHRFVRHHLPQAPLWLNEGLAEFYGTLEVGRGTAWVGRAAPEHLERLRREPRRPLHELIAARDEAAHAYRDGERAPAFYAEAWALVHYLLAGDGGRAAVAGYTALLRSGADPVEAFVEAFGDPRSLERGLDEHLARPAHEPLRVLVRPPGRGSEARAGAEPVRLEPADVHHRLGWLLVHHVEPRLEAARRHFEIALRTEPEHAGAWAGIGRVEELAGDDGAARQHYARAIELAPREPLPHFLLAQSLGRSAAALPAEERMAREGEAMLAAARDGFRRSLALEPDLAEAWAGLGAAWMADRSPAREGLEALHEAYRRLPARDDVLHNLIVCEARLGSRERAAQLYARLERRADPERVERTREALLRVELTHAERLLRDGRLEDAMAVLQRVMGETGDGELRAAVASRVETLERALAAGGGG